MRFDLDKVRIVGGIGADDEYWRALGRNEFRLPRCRGCQGWTWPAHFRCGHCGSWDFEWVTVEPVGQVFTWTRSWYAFDRVSERAQDVPYVTIVAELPEADGARVIGVLTGDEAGLAIGTRVRGVIRPPSAKTKHYPAIEWELDN